MILVAPIPVVADINTVDLDNNVAIVTITISDGYICAVADTKSIREMQKHGLTCSEDKAYHCDEQPLLVVVRFDCKFGGLPKDQRDCPF